MRLLMFPQWDKLSALLRTMARHSAADCCQRNIVRLEPKGGRGPIATAALARVFTKDRTLSAAVPCVAASMVTSAVPGAVSATASTNAPAAKSSLVKTLEFFTPLISLWKRKSV